MEVKNKILIIEDNKINSELLKKNLSTEYDVLQAYNGQEALDVLYKDPFAVSCILTDIVMPVMDGYEFITKILGDNRLENIPVIAISSDISNEERALSCGAWDFITKPYNFSVLKIKVKNACVRYDYTHLKAYKLANSVDELTALHSINYFKDNLKVNLKRVTEKAILIKFDVNEFKSFNEFYGVAFGDRLLKDTASIIETNRFNVILDSARVSNTDYFYVLVNSTIEKVEKILLSNYQIIFNHYKKTKLRFNTGIYEIEDFEESFESIDAKVSLAHKKSRTILDGFMVVYNDEMEEKKLYEQKLLKSLDDAFANEEFVPYIQPKYNNATNTYYGGEVLVRWMKDGKLIPPGEFIPLLESNGLIVKLDAYMLRKTLEIERKWIELDLDPVPLSLNFSRVDFFNDNIFEETLETIDSYNVPHNLIQIEVTESAFIEYESKISGFVDKCEKEGILVLMDDFGSGYSSLNTLKDLDISIIKLDYKFLNKSKNITKRNIIIESIVTMARHLNTPVVVEGVEKVEDAKYLKQIGIKFIQGYLYGKPMKVEEFEKLKKEPLNAIEFVKSTGVYNELMNTNSISSKLIETSINPAGLYRFDDKSLTIIRANEAMINSKLITKGHVIFGTTDIISLINENYRKKLIEYLRSLDNDLTPNEGFVYEIKQGEQIFAVKIKALLLMKYDQYKDFYIEHKFIPNIK